MGGGKRVRDRQHEAADPVRSASGRGVAERVLEQAKQICPFTKALSGADLTVSLAA